VTFETFWNSDDVRPFRSEIEARLKPEAHKTLEGLMRLAFIEGTISGADDVRDQIAATNRARIEALPARMRENVLTNQNQ
jgi:hypothetical protein